MQTTIDLPSIDVSALSDLVDRLPTDAVDLSAAGDVLSSVGDVAADALEIAVDSVTDIATVGARTGRRLGGAVADLVRRHPREVAGVLIAVLVALLAVRAIRSGDDDPADRP